MVGGDPFSKTTTSSHRYSRPVSGSTATRMVGRASDGSPRSTRQGRRRRAQHRRPAARQQHAHEEGPQAAEARGVRGAVLLQEREQRGRPRVRVLSPSSRAHLGRLVQEGLEPRVREVLLDQQGARAPIQQQPGARRNRRNVAPKRLALVGGQHLEGAAATSAAPSSASRRSTARAASASVPSSAASAFSRRRTASSAAGRSPPDSTRAASWRSRSPGASCSSAARTRSAASGPGAAPPPAPRRSPRRRAPAAPAPPLQGTSATSSSFPQPQARRGEQRAERDGTGRVGVDRAPHLRETGAQAPHRQLPPRGGEEQPVGPHLDVLGREPQGLEEPVGER